MPKINIDDICEPIEVTVGGKTYTVDDIPRDIARKITKITERSDGISAEIEKEKRRLNFVEKSDNMEAIENSIEKIAELNKELNDFDSFDELSNLMANILNADASEMSKLGIRKLLTLVRKITETVNEDIEGKNSQKVVAPKKP